VLLLTVILILISVVALVSIEASTEQVVGNNFPIYVVGSAKDGSDGCFKLCHWSLHTTTSCSFESNVYDQAARIFDSTQTLPSSANLQDNRTNTGSCTPVWESPACSASDAENNWIAVNFSKPTNIQCMSFIQEKSGVAEEMPMYGCQSIPTDLRGWTPEAECTKMISEKPKAALANQNHTGIFSGPLHVVKDTVSCSRKQGNFLTLQAAQIGKDNGDDTIVSCFCIQQLSLDTGLITPPYNTDEEKLCKEWSQSRLGSME